MMINNMLTSPNRIVGTQIHLYVCMFVCVYVCNDMLTNTILMLHYLSAFSVKYLGTYGFVKLVVSLL